MPGSPDDVTEEVSTSSGEPGTFATAYLWSRAGTIYSGSSEIQKNVIGERVLVCRKKSAPIGSRNIDGHGRQA